MTVSVSSAPLPRQLPRSESDHPDSLQRPGAGQNGAALVHTLEGAGAASRRDTPDVSGGGGGGGRGSSVRHVLLAVGVWTVGSLLLSICGPRWSLYPGLVKSADVLTPSEPDAGSSAPDGNI